MIILKISNDNNYTGVGKRLKVISFIPINASRSGDVNNSKIQELTSMKDTETTDNSTDKGKGKEINDQQQVTNQDTNKETENISEAEVDDNINENLKETETSEKSKEEEPQESSEDDRAQGETPPFFLNLRSGSVLIIVRR